MKQSLVLLQNNLHPEAEVLDIGLEERAKQLEVLTQEVLSLKDYWHNKIAFLH